MKLTFLGTCSGTEPILGYRHVSFVIEHADGVYWFDAGESCAYTAHLANIDLLKVRSIFISHTHMDHIGGLPNLLWNMRKLNIVTRHAGDRLTGRTVRILFPDCTVWHALEDILAATEGGFEIDYVLDVRPCHDGTVYSDEHGLRVRALHNEHMGTPAQDQRWKSFSFRIEAAGLSMVYSGDVKHVSELRPLLDGCDLLLMETGHHKVEDVCEYLVEEGRPVDRLGFIHHGRAILKDPEAELAKARRIFGPAVFIARDGDMMQL